MKKIFIACFSLLFCACSLSISEVQEDFVCGEDKVFDVDGNGYKTAYFDVDGGHDVEKEGQCWMAENLNVGKLLKYPEERAEDNDILEKYELDGVSGIYYRPEILHYGKERRQVCPTGWGFPQKEDWEDLQKNVFQGVQPLLKDEPNEMMRSMKKHDLIGTELIEGAFQSTLWKDRNISESDINQMILHTDDIEQKYPDGVAIYQFSITKHPNAPDDGKDYSNTLYGKAEVRHGATGANLDFTDGGRLNATAEQEKQYFFDDLGVVRCIKK